MRKIFLMCALLISDAAFSYEEKTVCAKYAGSNYYWSDGYVLQVQIYKGDELNQAVRSWNAYNQFNYYAVIWWGAGQASVIELDWTYYPGGMLSEATGVDQRGRSWKLNDYIGVCY